MRGVAPDASLVVLLSEIEIVGALSSSDIVIVPDAVPKTAFVGDERLSVNTSFSSSIASVRMVIGTAILVTDGAKVKVPLSKV